MKRRIAEYGLFLLLTLGMVATLPAAEKGHTHHGHDDHHKHGAHHQPARRHHDGAKTHHGKERASGHHHGMHKHDVWVTPPPAYRNKRSMRWTDAAAIARGKQLFQANCTLCHGNDGRGTGPAAKSLPHPPADLTHHFHNKPGDGDAYLYWRISEGGMVEPFQSMQSTMPAFKSMLSEDQRWDVLAYVHATYHKGFKSETMPSSVIGEGIVIAVVPASQQIVVNHAEIQGFMAAMTMGYKVNPPTLLDGLNAGDEVRFTIDTQQKTIVKIEKR